MPSQLHEGLISLFRHQPGLAPELLARALKADVPEYTEARIDSADLTEIQPTEYRADLVIQLRREHSVLGIVVEVQLSKDDDKGFVWPVYSATLRNRIRCPVCLLVVAPDAKVANWARQPIALTAERAVAELDTGRSQLYFDLIRCCLSEAARGLLDNMDPKKYEYQSDFARRYFSQGKEVGLVEGKAEEREIVITTLSDRFGALTESARDRIRNATAEEVRALFRRLFDAHTLNEALGVLG